MSKSMLCAFALVFAVGCGVEEAPLAVEIRNGWDAADKFTVEQGPSGVPLVDATPVGAHDTKQAATSARVRPGESVSLRLVRTVGGDATFFRTVTVPADASPDGVTFVFHLATDKTTPACPPGRTTCVLYWWDGQSEPPQLF